MITDGIMDHTLCFSKQQLVKTCERWQHYSLCKFICRSVVLQLHCECK